MSDPVEPAPVEAADGGVRIRLKAVPGAARNQIAGVLGDRLKVRIAAPPEGGKANAAIIALLSRALGVKSSAITILSGHTNPEKLVQVRGPSLAAARAALGLAAR